MTDLLHILPDFDTKPYTHLLPSLDKALITTNDLLTLDASHVAKRAQVPAGELRKLTDALIPALHHQLGFGAQDVVGNTSWSSNGEATWNCISTLDEEVDVAMGGGFPAGYLSEITGER
jgi:DNA repair protein RAD57